MGYRVLTGEQVQPGDIEVENIPSSVFNGEVVCPWPGRGGHLSLIRLLTVMQWVIKGVLNYA